MARLAGGPVIEEILPAVSASAEAYADPPGAVLFPGEAAAVAGAVGTRRREFATGRSCARRALGELGVAPAAIPRGEHGAPVWPAGVVGSITHCRGYRAAAVARASDLLAIGVDAEPDAPLPRGVLETVALPVERAMLRDLTARAPGTSWERVLFSAKESLYKAWFPLTRRWLGFEDAEIAIDAGGGTFGGCLLMSAPAPASVVPGGFTGRWLARGRLIVTAVTVPPAATEIRPK